MVEKDQRFVAEGSVRFSVAVKLPQWPTRCVVCATYCAETWELQSQRLTRGVKGSSAVVKGDLAFRVPVHISNASCLSKLKRPAPWPALAAAALFTLAVGAGMAAIAHPNLASRFGAFTAFAFVAGALAALALTLIYPGYLGIWQQGEKEYMAGFKDAGLAQEFVDLNRNMMLPWDRPKWMDSLVKWR